MTNAPSFAFGDYLFIPRRQLLLKDGQPVRIGCRALDLLEAFVRRPGEMLSKRQLLEEAWPSTTVVEGNLKVHIAALRRALDDDADFATYIATVNGRGYRFIAPVVASGAGAAVGAGGQSKLPGGEVGDAPPAPPEFQDIVALLAQTMRSTVIDLPREAVAGEPATALRRVLFIELTARDEAWIEDMFAQRRQAVSATP
ncbi:winged helix-turn-helix domain-containing protein [Caulobacter endophyticus]|uniref:winged helix-turn-helix domain-containing protein n=1 Tax=Caulobacter endophyticus TaxID=2172652 RepID=UPI00240F9DEC|nr:transcriptional regulator [Caulobacter endophyticus]MDG2527933.1 transcriptional regulator [Caulobacter endophyticus]